VYRIMQNLSIIRWYMLDDENPQFHWVAGWKKKNPADVSVSQSKSASDAESSSSI
jgi:hypothetical protein